MTAADKTCHVLVLDDDATFVSILARALRRRGHRVSEALNVEAALLLAAQDAPDLAVVDLKIAQESGLDAVPALLERNAAMRILILTGYSSIATAVAAIKLGAWDYACKPLDADEILQKLGLGEAAAPAPMSAIPDQPLSVERLEWEHIQRVLAENAGNISATARSLGMHRRTLQRKLLKRPVRQ
ncbi:MAG: response regulator [Nevskiaceae bacterium]|jgi:two-component system response regulator RegA|nr:response regulator [Nevskiaceae bacterium]